MLCISVFCKVYVKRKINEACSLLLNNVPFRFICRHPIQANYGLPPADSSSEHRLILDSRARDEEPFVDASVDRRWWKIIAWWNLAELAWIDASWRVRNSDIGAERVNAAPFPNLM